MAKRRRKRLTLPADPFGQMMGELLSEVQQGIVKKIRQAFEPPIAHIEGEVTPVQALPPAPAKKKDEPVIKDAEFTIVKPRK